MLESGSMIMNSEGDNDPSVRRRTRSMDGHFDRSADNGSIASAITVEEYEEIVRSELHTGSPATSCVQDDQQIDNHTLGPIRARHDRRTPVVHLSYTGVHR